MNTTKETQTSVPLLVSFRVNVALKWPKQAAISPQGTPEILSPTHVSLEIEVLDHQPTHFLLLKETMSQQPEANAILEMVGDGSYHEWTLLFWDEAQPLLVMSNKLNLPSVLLE